MQNEKVASQKFWLVLYMYRYIRWSCTRDTHVTRKGKDPYMCGVWVSDRSSHVHNMHIYWKEKETHILTFKTSDLLWVEILSRWRQFIPTYTDNKISQQISLTFDDDTFHLWWRHCHVQAYTDYTLRKLQLENKSFSALRLSV